MLDQYLQRCMKPVRERGAESGQASSTSPQRLGLSEHFCALQGVLPAERAVLEATHSLWMTGKNDMT